MQLCKLLHLHRQNVQHLKSLHAHITPINPWNLKDQAHIKLDLQTDVSSEPTFSLLIIVSPNVIIVLNPIHGMLKYNRIYGNTLCVYIALIKWGLYCKTDLVCHEIFCLRSPKHKFAYTFLMNHDLTINVNDGL